MREKRRSSLPFALGLGLGAWVTPGCTAEDGVAVDPDASLEMIDEHDAGAGPIESHLQPMAADPADLGSFRELPLRHGVRYRAATSADRGGMTFDGIPRGNKDFNNFVAVCDRDALPAQVIDASSACDEGISGYVLARDDDGPGVTSRIFLTGLSWTHEHIRIYADDLVTPQIDVLVSDWVDGTQPPFGPPLTEWTSGALIDYVPIAYQSKLRVVLDDVESSAFVYYHVGVAHLPHTQQALIADPTSLQAELERAAAAREPDIQDALTYEPGASMPLFAADGGGTIERLELSVSPPAGLADLRLEARWDGEREAAISGPLATLFGCFQEPTSFETAPMAVLVDADAIKLRLSLPMPYARGAQLVLANTGSETAQVSVHLALGPAPDSARYGRLHALAHERRAPIAAGERYHLAALRGRGKYIGTLVRFAGGAASDQDWPYDFSFLEGDEHITIDGAPAVRGTGTEDYFNGGWYFQDGLYAMPFSALISAAASDESHTGRATMVRWHIAYDALEFQKSLDFDFEYGNDVPATVSDYASVAFYYLE